MAVPELRVNILYDDLRERLLTAQFNWMTAPVWVAFVSDGYVADPAHINLTDIPTGALLARTGPLTSKDATGGYARGIPPEMKLFRNGTPVAGIVLFENTGIDATSKLICYTNDGPALPFLGVGFDYAVAFNAALGGFFRA